MLQVLGCSSAPLRLEFLQVHGPPLAEPPTVDVVYEADLEVPFVSQECRSLS